MTFIEISSRLHIQEVVEMKSYMDPRDHLSVNTLQRCGHTYIFFGFIQGSHFAHSWSCLLVNFLVLWIVNFVK